MAGFDDEVKDLLGSSSLPPSNILAAPEGSPLLESDKSPAAAPGGAAAAPEKLEWGDVPMQAAKNFVPSVTNFAHGLIQPIIHPIDTLSTIKDLGVGVGSKLADAAGVQMDPSKKAEREKVADAVGQFYKDRYGSGEGFKKALATDPVGVLGDASMLISGGGTALARAPGVVGRVGSAVATAGNTINPINIAAKAAAPVAGAAMKTMNIPLMATTGAPRESLNAAYAAGKAKSQPFYDQLSGRAEPSVVVDAAHDAFQTLADRRRNEYLNSMAGMKANARPVDFTPINQALLNAAKDVTHGNKRYRPAAADMLEKMTKEIIDWQRQPNTNGVMFNNLEGVDKLKQLIGEMRTSAPPGSPEQAMATRIYGSIKNTLTKHDPAYQSAMGAYGEASDTLRQLKQTLSINPKASVDTTLRKLLLGQKQVDGNKGSLLAQLNEVNPEIGNMLAGHILHPIFPIGLRGAIGSSLAGAGGLAALGTATNPIGIAAHIAASSPRVVGTVNYGVGRLSSKGPLGNAAAMLSPRVIDAATEPQAEAPDERPFFPGEGETRPREITVPVGRTRRASGGAVNLMALAKSARRAVTKDTEQLLKTPDEHVVKALEVAGRSI